MKLSVGKRILMFIHWLVSLLIVAAFAVYLIVPDFLMPYYEKVVAALGERDVRIIGIALLAVYAILAVVQVCLIFKRRKRSDRGFITVDSSDTGKVRIAITAIEQMVRQSVNNIDGITEMKINIDNQDDAIVIGVNANIVNGSHVPTITMNMQRAIRQFVEMNCGVAVRAVSININAVTDTADASRRRRGTKGKQAEALATPVVSEPAREPASQSYRPYAPVEEPKREPVAEPAPVPVTAEPEPRPEPQTPVFDLNKPYESEFAKDLAAMKAAEAAQSAGDWEGEEHPRGDDEV